LKGWGVEKVAAVNLPLTFPGCFRVGARRFGKTFAGSR
jgi:hypothetical protein